MSSLRKIKYLKSIKTSVRFETKRYELRRMELVILELSRRRRVDATVKPMTKNTNIARKLSYLITIRPLLPLIKQNQKQTRFILAR